MDASFSTWLGASFVSSSHSRSAAASGASPGSMLPAGSSHSTRLTLCLYCRINTMRPSSRIGIRTTHGACRTVAISCARPSGSGTVSTSIANTRVEHTIAMNLLRELVEHLLQVGGQRAREFHAAVFRGMRDHELRGMEKRTLQMRDGAQIARHPAMYAAIDRVADDGMADLAQVHANLMGAAGVDRDVSEGEDD